VVLGPPAFGGRLLPLVVELRPKKGLVVVSQLAAVLGPPAFGGRYVSQLAVRSALRRLRRLGLA